MDESLIFGMVIGLCIGIGYLAYVLGKVIAHLIITFIALSIIWYFLGEPDFLGEPVFFGKPDRNGWWSLIGFILIFGQFQMAKEALFDKPAAKH